MATAPKAPAVPMPPEGTTCLSEGSVFEGQWKGVEVVVQGRLEGEVTLSGRLRISRGGAVLGRVRADTAEIGGEFTGEVHARLIAFNEYARARGTFVSERIVIRDGAVVDGAFDRPKETPATPGASVVPKTAEAQPQAGKAPATPPTPENGAQAAASQASGSGVSAPTSVAGPAAGDSSKPQS